MPTPGLWCDGWEFIPRVVMWWLRVCTQGCDVTTESVYPRLWCDDPECVPSVVMWRPRMCTQGCDLITESVYPGLWCDDQDCVPKVVMWWLRVCTQGCDVTTESVYTGLWCDDRECVPRVVMWRPRVCTQGCDVRSNCELSQLSQAIRIVDANWKKDKSEPMSCILHNMELFKGWIKDQLITSEAKKNYSEFFLWKIFTILLMHCNLFIIVVLSD